MLELEDKLKELSNYSINFAIVNGYYSVTIKYNSGWVVIKDDKGNIHVETKEDVTYYIASMENITIGNILDLIYKTIDYNTQLKKKKDLLKIKVNELTEIFNSHDYDTLTKLTFNFEKSKRGRPKKETLKIKDNDK